MTHTPGSPLDSLTLVALGRHPRGVGFAIGPERVVTNAHNLRGDEVTVRAGGVRQVGRVLAADQDRDLAVVAVDLDDPRIASSSAADLPAVGDTVHALAVTADGGTRLTSGSVAALTGGFRTRSGWPVRGVIEHTAPLAPGSSGGPLLAADGTVLGINTNRLGGGLYQAIPWSADTLARLEALGRGETPQRPTLGVALASPSVARRRRAAVGLEPIDGLLVTGVVEGSAADEAGLAAGDLLVAVNGQALHATDDLLVVIPQGDPLRLTVIRGVDEREVDVTPA